MSFQAECPQCLCVSRQVGQPRPCLLHISLAAEVEAVKEDYDEPYSFGELRLTVDRPGPFTLREYVRLQLLRTRLEADPSALDAPAPRAQARSLSRR
jgi:hypothetical protein